MNRTSKTPAAGILGGPAWWAALLTLLLYAIVGVYLFRPYFGNFSPRQYIIPLNSITGAMGCFVLSRRWLSEYAAAFFAGAIYGFCPFMLGFAAYHPAASVPVALLPWLFCPAVFYGRQRPETFRTNLIKAVLVTVVFVFIAAYFSVLACPSIGPLFPLPKDAGLSFSSLRSLVVPLSAKPPDFIFSVYHIPLFAGLLGFLMYLAVHRIKVLIVVGAGIILSVAGPVFNVSPIVWVSIPALYCAVLAGLGMEALALCGYGDRKWLLLCILLAAAAGIITFVAGTYFGLGVSYIYASEMYAVAAVLMAAILFIARAHLRWRMFRWVLLCASALFDILAAAACFVDKIF